MKCTSITIDNYLGIDHLEIAPGAVTSIEGGNNRGKTSVVETLIAAVGGGNDATLLRKGAKQGQVVVVFDDGMKLTCTAKGEKLERTVEHPKLGPLKNVAPYLERLRDMLSVNPIAFLNAPQKKQLEAFLEIAPIEVSDDDLRAAGAKVLPPSGKNGLERIALARKAVYEERTRVNGALRERKATVASLEKSLPTGLEPTDWQAAAEEAERQKAALEKRVGQETERIVADVAEDLRTSDRACSTETASLEAELKDLERGIRDRIRQAETRRDDRNKELEVSRDRRKEEISAAAAPTLERLTATAAEARERARQADREENTRRILDEQRSGLGSLAQDSEALTQALERLDELKERALSKLPIKDVEIVDGQIEVGGIPLHRLNKAKQVQLALNLARLRAGELGLVCVDGMEALDPETFAAFEVMAANTGLQFIVSRVTSGPLTVRNAA